MYRELVCPCCKGVLDVTEESLKCADCKIEYLVIDGIPVFIESAASEKWSEYTGHIYGSEALKSDDRYSSHYYKNNWKAVLDLGCGCGVYSAPLSDKVEKIFCVDPSLYTLQKLETRGQSNMCPIAALGDKLPFQDNFFDAVLFIFVLEHLKNPMPTLEEIRRVLKEDGELIITTDGKYVYQLFSMIGRLTHKTKSDMTHVNLMTPVDLRRYLKNADFKIQEENIIYPTRKSLYRYIPEFLAFWMHFRCSPVKGW